MNLHEHPESRDPDPVIRQDRLELDLIMPARFEDGPDRSPNDLILELPQGDEVAEKQSERKEKDS